MFEGRELKNKLRARDICLGVGINFTDPCVAELLSESGFDFFIIDSEHSALDIESVQLNIMATKGSRVAALVRVPWNDAVMIKRVLDAGAAGVLVPMVRTVDDVRQAVAACMYPPAGMRGFGPRRPSAYERHFPEVIASANDNLIVWVQIEHIDAVNNIDQILRVDRLDGVFVGACDLSSSMGLLGRTDHPDVLAAIDRTIAAAQKAEVPVGIAGPTDPAIAVQWIKKGIQFITLGWDEAYLVQASQAAVNGVKRLLREKD